MWVTLESAAVSEIAAALGLDWVVIDTEHGQLDWREVADHLRALVRGQTVALVRITQLDAGSIKRALDLGADGIVIPCVETAAQLRDAVRFAHYPPRGIRGIGAERATGWGQCIPQHVAEAEASVLIVPLIETVTAGKNIAEIAAVEGVELLFFGPADFSASAGHAGQWEGPGVAEQILAARDAIRAAGKHCGIMTTSPEDFQRRREQGFSLLGLGSDTGFIVRSLRAALTTQCGRDDQIAASLIPRP